MLGVVSYTLMNKIHPPGGGLPDGGDPGLMQRAASSSLPLARKAGRN